MTEVALRGAPAFLGEQEVGTDTRVYAATSTASTFHFRRLDGSFSLYARQGLSREVNKQDGESKKEEQETVENEQRRRWCAIKKNS